METTRKIKLESSDGQIFEIDFEIAQKSETIKNMIQDLGDDNEEAIPFPNVTGEVLGKVIDWMTVVNEEKDEKGEQYVVDDDFENAYFNPEIVSQELLFSIILAANYMDLKSLLDRSCKTVANMIKGKTPEEIRKTFNIKNDFTPEEEEQIRKENEWVSQL